jgi:hypothetical protein
MRIATALILVLLGSAVASGQWKKGDEQLPDTADRKSVNGFGGHLLIVEDPKAFIEEWKKPETPHINPVTEVKRGVLLAAIVLFAGCKPDAQGACNAEVDYVVYKPNGEVYAERKAQRLWKETAPAPPIIQLGEALLAIRLEENDPAGEYKVKAKLADLNANVTFELVTSLRLK